MYVELRKATVLSLEKGYGTVVTGFGKRKKEKGKKKKERVSGESVQCIISAFN